MESVLHSHIIMASIFPFLVLQEIRKMSHKSRAKRISSETEKKTGGVVSVVSPSDIPKDRQQVYNQLRKVEGGKRLVALVQVRLQTSPSYYHYSKRESSSVM